MLRRIVLLALFSTAACVAVCAQTDGRSGVVLERGQLQLRRGPGLVLTVMRVRLRLADGAAVSGELEAGAQDAGSDPAGAFERQRFRLKPGGDARGVKSATLEVRRYRNTGALVAWLDYDGPPLAPREGVQLVSSLDRFARGMATKRFKIYWTAPVFFSDYRFLGPANQLVLWRQTEGEDYHLLVPLAGGGMVGEVGVSEIEWRPEFRVTASSYDPGHAPRRVPLFAYAAGRDPYKLPREAYETAFAATGQYGRLRWQKPYPEVFAGLGWCSWNAYGQEVTADKVVTSVRSMREKQIPLGFVLVDDGWLSVKDQKLTAFEADAAKFPGGMAALARRLREEYRVPHVGVWHTFQGYWNGVEADSEVARKHRMFKGLEGKLLPDPRDGRGEGFYEDWFGRLKSWGYDFVKVDGQGNNLKFTDGLMPLFDSGGGSHRNLQRAAEKFFGGRTPQGAAGLGLINCMEMSLENAYNWHTSNVARSSDDYQPELKHNPKDHVFQNAYNAFWLANFAYPDWDMFQSHDPAAEYHAAARAVSGGPVYFTDEPGRERPDILRRLALSDGRVLMADEPAQVTRDLLLSDPSIESRALKVFARVTRPGLRAGVVAAFNVNKTASPVPGALNMDDPEWPAGAPPRVAVYSRKDGRAALLERRSPTTLFSLGDDGFDLFTLAPDEGGVAVFGLLDKYLSPAAVASLTRGGGATVVRLREAGDFGAWLAQAPARVELDGAALRPSSYSYAAGLLRIPRASFGTREGEREVRIVTRPGRNRPR